MINETRKIYKERKRTRKKRKRTFLGAAAFLVKSALVTTGARAGSAGRAATAALELPTLRARPRKLVESVAAMIVGGREEVFFFGDWNQKA